MELSRPIKRPELAIPEKRKKLKYRSQPYFNLFNYGRHIGYQTRANCCYWVARYRTKEGTYCQHRLGVTDDVHPADGKVIFNYSQACELARVWFKEIKNLTNAAQERPIGIRRHLVFSPTGGTFTIGHALHDYVEWKRLSAAKTHFETLLSRINHHIVPRLASMPVSEFSGDAHRKFLKDVMETPARRGNQKEGPFVPIQRMDEDTLRKRKKTANTLSSILRVALRMAWENGHIDDERAWRKLRRLPVVDKPRMLHLSRAECRDLLKECRPDVRTLVLGALYTGCRATELLRMKCLDVGRDGYGVYIMPVKRYRARFVFLPDEAMIWFLSLINGRKPDEYVFMREDGKPWYNRSYRWMYDAAIRAAGLPKEFTFHGLRHTYASQLVQAGATVYAVAEQLGHSNPTTVLNTYGHLSPQIRESEVRQRFTILDSGNAHAAEQQAEELRAWRASMQGGNGETYARISNLSPTGDQSDILPRVI